MYEIGGVLAIAQKCVLILCLATPAGYLRKYSNVGTNKISLFPSSS